jgi:hypothetical protein
MPPLVASNNTTSGKQNLKEPLGSVHLYTLYTSNNTTTDRDLAPQACDFILTNFWISKVGNISNLVNLGVNFVVRWLDFVLAG